MSSHGPFYANLVLLATVLVRRDVSKTLKCWWTAEGEMSNIYCMSPSAGIGVVNIEVVTIWGSPYHCLESADGVGDMSVQNWTTLPLLRKHECLLVLDSAPKHMSAC